MTISELAVEAMERVRKSGRRRWVSRAVLFAGLRRGDVDTLTREQVIDRLVADGFLIRLPHDQGYELARAA